MIVKKKMVAYLNLAKKEEQDVLFRDFRYERHYEDLLDFKYLGEVEVTTEIEIDLDGYDYVAEMKICGERYKQYKKEQAA